MAATRLIAMHENKGRSISKSLKDRTDYAKNADKTEGGKYISSYACNVELADKEFAQSKKEYFEWTGRKPKGDIIAYQIRQSFKPGEITPEKANEVGYETAIRFTKGEHAFIVATHVDKSHIHNHIIFNSTNLACNKKFRDSWFIALALQRLSDLVCLENGLSVIKPRRPSERERYTGYEKKKTLREKICEDIEFALLQQPQDFHEFLKLLQEQGYEIRGGKHLAVKGNNQKRFIQFRSLGEGYSKEDIENRILNNTDIKRQELKKENTKKKYSSKKELDLLIDIQEKMKQGKGIGYTKWATVYNIKQMAQTLLFLQERDIRDYEALAQMASGASLRFHELSEEIKTAEKRLGEIAVLKTHILNYVKTRDVFVDYKKSGYSKMFYADHERELILYNAARDAFDKLPDKKIPKIKELNVEYAERLSYKKELYSEYRQVKKEMQNFVTAKHNIDSFLRIQDTEVSAKKKKTQKRENDKSRE